MLADSGWHCSYCFRTIPEYIVKMKGFSHADRIGGRLDLLEPQRIQETICRGKDIFGMLPEAYSVSLHNHTIYACELNADVSSASVCGPVLADESRAVSARPSVIVLSLSLAFGQHTLTDAPIDSYFWQAHVCRWPSQVLAGKCGTI